MKMRFPFLRGCPRQRDAAPNARGMQAYYCIVRTRVAWA